jgi:hypothetical protein
MGIGMIEKLIWTDGERDDHLGGDSFVAAVSQNQASDCARIK